MIMKVKRIISLFIAVLFLPSLCYARNQLAVRAVNKLSIARSNQTIELTARQLASFDEKDLAKIHVKDSSGSELLCQAVDTDYDDYHKPDMLIFGNRRNPCRPPGRA